MKHLTYLIAILLLGFLLGLYKLEEIPSSLHGDEIGVGYNAFTLLTKGIDEYGSFLPFVFRSDIPPIIFYVTIPSIFFLGLTDFAVRLPSVFVACATSAVFFFFCLEITKYFNTQSRRLHLPPTKTALLCSLFLTISPWHIQVSRIVHDASYALLFQFLGLTLFFKSMRSKHNLLIFCSMVVFGLSLYSYHSPRVTTPLMLVSLFVIFRKQLWNNRTFLFSLVIFFVMALPIVIDLLGKPVSETRFGGINIFIREPGKPYNVPALLYTFTKNYVNQFNPRHIFFDSSETRYFNVHNYGLMHTYEVLLIPLGIVLAIFAGWWLPLFWLSIAALPGALTSGTPNAGRILLILPFLVLFSAIAIITVYKHFKFRRLLMVLCMGLLMLGMGKFLWLYFIDSPHRFYAQWQYGQKQIALYIGEHENEFDQVIVSDQLKQAYIYLLFYGRKNPDWLRAQAKIRHPFVGYTTIGKYNFRSIDWGLDQTMSNALIVGLPNEIPENNFIIQRIYSPNFTELYRIAKTPPKVR